MDATPFSRTRASYLISSDSSLLSVPTIFTFMEDPQWKHRKNYTPKTLQTLLSHSFCLGLYKVSISGKSSEFKQIGFTRLITDHVSFAIVADVYVIEGERGQGLGKWLLECADEVSLSLNPKAGGKGPKMPTSDSTMIAVPTTKDTASNDPVTVTHVPEYGTPPNHPVDAPSGFCLFPSCDIFHPEADERITIVHAISTTTRTITVIPTSTASHHLPLASPTRRQAIVIDSKPFQEPWGSLPTDRPIQLDDGTCIMDCNKAYQWLLMMPPPIETHIPATTATAAHPPKMQASSIPTTTSTFPPVSAGTGTLAPGLSSSSSPLSTPPPPAPSHHAEHHQPLNTGAFVGVFFGVIVGVAGLLAGVWLLARRARKRKVKMNARTRGVHREREKGNGVWWRKGEEGGEPGERKGPGGVLMV